MAGLTEVYASKALLAAVKDASYPLSTSGALGREIYPHSPPREKQSITKAETERLVGKRGEYQH